MIKRHLVIIGNWKMNKTIAETKKFFRVFKKLYDQASPIIANTTRFGFGVPSTSLALTRDNGVVPHMIVAAENIHHQIQGAYTGELSAAMVKAAGANAVIVGHSERRQYFHETDHDVNAKIQTALTNHLVPIVCVGETLQERKNRQWRAVIKNQIRMALVNISSAAVATIIIAYEPIWAIGTGITASVQDAQKACKFIRSIVKKMTSQEVAASIIIQYGGSVSPSNIAKLMEQEDIDGALVGSASLDPQSFIKLLTLNQ